MEDLEDLEDLENLVDLDEEVNNSLLFLSLLTSLLRVTGRERKHSGKGVCVDSFPVQVPEASINRKPVLHPYSFVGLPATGLDAVCNSSTLDQIGQDREPMHKTARIYK